MCVYLLQWSEPLVWWAEQRAASEKGVSPPAQTSAGSSSSVFPAKSRADRVLIQSEITNAIYLGTVACKSIRPPESYHHFHNYKLETILTDIFPNSILIVNTYALI